VINSDGIFYGADQVFRTPSTMSPAAWHSTQLTALGNAATGSRTGAVHNTGSIYFYKGTDNHIWCVYLSNSQWLQQRLSTTANVDDWLAFYPSWNLVYYKGTDNHLW